MSKKNRQMQKAAEARPAIRFQGISSRGWKVVGMGIGIVALGFYLLSLTDPEGQNWASNLCPFVILGGYAVIGIGIVLPESKNILAPSPEKKL